MEEIIKINNKRIFQVIVLGSVLFFTFHFTENRSVYNTLFDGNVSNFDIQRVLLPLSWSKSVEFILMLMLTCYSGYFDTKHKVYERIFCGIGSFFLITGYSMYVTGSFFENFLVSENRGGVKESLYFIFLLVGGYYFCLVIYSFITKIIKRVLKNNVQKLSLPDKRGFLKDFFAISIAYLIVCIIRFPGGIGYDEYYQVEAFLADNITSAHWPPANSVFMGMIVRAGISIFGNKDAGYFLLCFIQSVIVAFSLAYSIKVMRKLGACCMYTNIVRALYIFSPTFFVWTTEGCKDSLFASLVLLFLSLGTEYLYFSRSLIYEILIGITGVLFSLTRKNGIIIIYMWTICLIVAIFKKKAIHRLFLVMICVIVINSAYNSIILPAFNIKPASIREALAIPFQQTARVASRYSDEATEDEIDAINRISDYEGMKNDYNPYNVDCVKDYYNENKEGLRGYFLTWIRQFFKYPLTYFDATIANSHGYFYPNVTQYNLSRDSFYSYDWVTEINRESTYEGCFILAKYCLAQYVFVWEYFPLLSMLTNSAVLFWLTIYMALYLMSRLKTMEKEMFLLVPSVVGMLICVAGPTFVNHGNRYALPVSWCTFLLIIICLRNKIKRN